MNSEPALLLSRREVARLLTMPECIEAVEKCFTSGIALEDAVAAIAVYDKTDKDQDLMRFDFAI